MQDDTFKGIIERYGEAFDADQDNRQEAIDDMQFIAGEQWPASVKQARENANRPCITINRMPQFLRQVTGDIRQTNPAIQILPSDADASEEMADIYNGLIRSIEYHSDAASVYERAAESAAACGMGAFRVHYRQGRDGNDAYIEQIPNPFAVYWDPLAKDPTRKDARYCFVTDMMGREEFKKKYPKAACYDFNDDSIPANLRDWYTKETVRIAEYWCKEDGPLYAEANPSMYRIKWFKVNGQSVLEKGEFPGEHLPIIAVMGEEMHVGERIIRTSVIRHAKDAQRLYNYWRSAQTELIALQPKAPFVATPKQVAGHESDWDGANNDNLPYLLYNPDPNAPGAPQRASPPVPSSGMMQEIALASDDMKATTGIYDAALGNQSNETSGVAIRQRQLESDISTSIYVDNLSKSIAQCGRVLVGLIPTVYDTTRIVQIVGEDGAASLAELNVPKMTPIGPVYMNDVTFGQYDVRIKTGPSYTTQRQESVDNLMALAEKFPLVGQIGADIVARNMDWPGADELADRLAKFVNNQFPGMVENEDEPTPEEQQAMMQQQQVQQQQQAMAQAMAEAEITKASAEATEAEADAQKAQVEAAQAGMELAMQNGSLNAVIEQAVEAQVTRILQSMMGAGNPI